MRFLKSWIAGFAVGAALACGAAASAQEAGSTLYGAWRNPKGTVNVEIRPCGPGACGYIVWADAGAQAAARKAGTEQLVGLRVFRDLTQDQSGAWKGKVFAPDLNMTFAGTVRLVDARSLRAKGCLVGGLFCKSQLWTRVS